MVNIDSASYFKAWDRFLALHSLESLEMGRPLAISYKVADTPALYDALRAVVDNTEQIDSGTVNDRFIASVVLLRPLEERFRLLKILVRRSNSSHPLGLDSIDFLVDDLEQTLKILQSAGCPVREEHNTMHAWLSLRFGPDNLYEAKFTDRLVLAVAIKKREEQIESIVS